MNQISWHTDRSSLPSLALTCRTFEGPALDALWKNFPSLEPLVNCIPTHHWDFSFQGELPIDAKAWATFHKYASRIRSITQSGDSSPINGHIRMLMLSYPYPSSTFGSEKQSDTPRHRVLAHGICSFLGFFRFTNFFDFAGLDALVHYRDHMS